MEDVDDEVHEVEKHPSPLLNTFDMVDPYAFALELGDEMFANCADVRVRCAARNYEVVGHICDAAQIQQYDVVRFHVQADAGCTHRGRGGLAGGCRWGN